MIVNQVNIIRAIAVLGIIALHVTSGQVNNHMSIFVVNQWVRFASPLFIIISGMILCYIEVKRPSPTYTYFFKRRFTKVVVPYIVWTFIYSLYTSRHMVMENIVRSFHWDSVFSFITTTTGHVLTGSGFVHLYFILIMVQLYALFPLLLRWLKFHSLSLLIVSFIVSAVCLSLIYLHQLRFIQLPVSPIPYVTLSPNWIFYFVLGMVAADNQDRWIKVLQGYKAGVLLTLAFLISFSLLIVDGKLTNTYSISVKPSTFFYALSSFFLFYSILFSIKSEKLRIWTLFKSNLDWIAKNSFLFYLLHPLCLSILVKIGNIYGFNYIWMREIGAFYLFSATLITTSIGVICINVIPFASWFGGNSMQKISLPPQKTKNNVDI